MAKFLNVMVRERVEGEPGFMEAREFPVTINVEQITLFNKAEEDASVTFVRLSCGITLCIAMPLKKLIEQIKK